LKPASIEEALKKVLPEKYHHMLPVNMAALSQGEELLLKSAAPDAVVA
jgi:hypothetical protein